MVVAASLVIILLVGGVVVYCISKQRRKENKRRSRRRQSENRVDQPTRLSSGENNRSDAHHEMRPMYHRQHGNNGTRFVPNQQSRRSQGLGDTHALLRVRLETKPKMVIKRGLFQDGTSTAGSILRPSTFGVPPESRNGMVSVVNFLICDL